MYILSFKRSRSKYFEKGLALAERLGGTWDGRQMILKIPDQRLLDAYESLLPLFEIIQNWSSTRATFDGKKVHPYRFILFMHFVKECASESNRNKKNCWLNDECKGWGCKKLSNIYYLELGNGKYKRNDRYWYNFGRFNSKNEWEIDKQKISDVLIQFAVETGLYLCPHFNRLKVKYAVNELPSRIIPDDVLYRIYFTDVYSKGERIKFPENIRHIPPAGMYQDGSDRMKYDITKLRIMRFHEDGKISADAMRELLRKEIGKN